MDTTSIIITPTAPIAISMLTVTVTLSVINAMLEGHTDPSLSRHVLLQLNTKLLTRMIADICATGPVFEVGYDEPRGDGAPFGLIAYHRPPLGIIDEALKRAVPGYVRKLVLKYWDRMTKRIRAEAMARLNQLTAQVAGAETPQHALQHFDFTEDMLEMLRDEAFAILRIFKTLRDLQSSEAKFSSGEHYCYVLLAVLKPILTQTLRRRPMDGASRWGAHACMRTVSGRDSSRCEWGADGHGAHCQCVEGSDCVIPLLSTP